MHCHPPRQRLADRFEQREAFSSPRESRNWHRVCVGDALQAGEQVGNSVNFVENYTFRKLGRERAGIFSGGEGSYVGGFQRLVLELCK